ncbi:MAG: phenylalanine 4-monooxygenase [Gammaproteobacteria bacterium]|nr:phenylalanine 4-monooxygenase [Gammaproteobacteria bacterium]
MAKASKYVAKIPDRDGIIRYSDEENAVWQELITRQKAMIKNRACDEYLDALDRLDLPEDRVPQCADISRVLRECTGWEVAPVPALINFDKFFQLLADKKFPAASFIRSREELDYLQEPDIFHEIFGHTPLLTDPRFAAFTHAYGKAGLAASKEDRVMLARLYWFTVEFGLIQRRGEELRTYGAGIVSSIGEMPYALDSNEPERRVFDPVDALRTPYRIDIYQTVYFIIESFDELYSLAQRDLMSLIKEARRLGMHAPTYPPQEERKSA